ncbi:MAG: SBBP repeat-containing protein [Candidatus Binataceae bacterium]
MFSISAFGALAELGADQRDLSHLRDDLDCAQRLEQYYNTIEVIGAGGESAGAIGGSGGGSYSGISNLSLTPGSRVTYQAGTAGGSIKTTGATWFNGTSISNASVSAEGGCSATATSGCTNSTTNNVGTIIYAGGKGAGGVKGIIENSGGGGGGAGGPHGVGAPGAAGTDSSAGAGGAGDNGFGGAGGSPLSGGGAGEEYYTAGGVTAGSGGGGGGLYYLGPGAGGNYGGGSGGAGNATGGNGLIVITYAPSPALFVANSSFTAYSSPPVTAYPLSSNGNVSPLPSATPTPETGLGGPVSIARDRSGNLYVANQDIDSVTIYPAGASGNVAPTATIAGANTGLINPTGIALDSNSNIYVANAASLEGGPDSVTVFAVGSNGNVTPTATITGTATGLAYPTAITLDPSGNIYVANSGSQIGGVDSITVYPAGSNGNVQPSATISGGSTGLLVPWGIALDSVDNIYVANDGSTVGALDSVTVYPAGSNGNVTPSTTITGANTGLDSPGGITVDSGANIYVTNDGGLYGGVDSIAIYAPGSNGNATPSNDLFALGLLDPSGIVVDSGGNLYVADDGSNEDSLDAITVYPPNNPEPSETIGLDTALDVPAGIALDLSGNIYVTNQGSIVGGLDSVNIYPQGSYANAPLSAAIVGANTGLAQPFGVTYFGGSVYVANSVGAPDGLGSVTVYPSGSNGNVTPSATISGNSSGDNTGFNFPTGLAMDASGNLYVANAYGGPDGYGSITIYSAESNGNVTPIATISDNPSCAPCDNTGLNSPYGVAIDFSGKIYVVNSAGGPDDAGSVTVYAPLGTSTGILNETPSATISGASWTVDKTEFDSPSGLALDSNANIYVANDGSSVGGVDSITVYPAGSNGDVAPTAAITGSNTGLGTPMGIALTWNGGFLGGSSPASARKPPRRQARRRARAH